MVLHEPTHNITNNHPVGSIVNQTAHLHANMVNRLADELLPWGFVCWDIIIIVLNIDVSLSPQPLSRYTVIVTQIAVDEVG
jgi:hypothetical protein